MTDQWPALCLSRRTCLRFSQERKSGIAAAGRLAGERERAARLMSEAGDWVQPQDVAGWLFLSNGYGLPDPWQLAKTD